MSRFAALCLSLLLSAPSAATDGLAPGAADHRRAVELIQARDLDAALVAMRRAAAAGHPEAIAELGSFHLHGLAGLAKDPVEAMRWYEKAAGLGSPMAMYNIAHLYSEGLGVTADQTVALQWLRRAGEAGLVEAQVALGGNYYSGQHVAQDRAEAWRWFRMAADAGNAAAQAALGTLYLRGEGVARDVAESARWFERAAEQGHALAQFNLGVMLLGDDEVGDAVARDPARAVAWLERAAGQGYGQAAFRLSELHRQGDGVAVDDQAALRWLEIAANAGHAEAQYRLGERLLDGDGVVADLAMARKWLTMAGQQGHLLAGLAWRQAEHEAEQLAAVPADAVARTRRLAGEGDAEAMRDLGLMYRDGRGIARDDDEAIAWLGKAADAGDADAALDAAELLRGTPSTAKDPRIVGWLEQAATAGRIDASFLLARHRIDAAGGPRDYRAARERLRAVADAPDTDESVASDAAYWLGWMSLRGLGGRASAAEAARWFRRALGDGDPSQLARWANQHRYASGDHYSDPALAVAWTTLAAAAGEEEARKRVDAQAADTAPYDRALAASLVAAWQAMEKRP